jgi:hypothetical protein
MTLFQKKLSGVLALESQQKHKQLYLVEINSAWLYEGKRPVQAQARRSGRISRGRAPKWRRKAVAKEVWCA